MTQPDVLTAVVADDEQLARDELCFLLSQLDNVDVVGRASNGLEALEQIARHSPDVAFLDVQMPGLTGFEVARRLLGQGTQPGVIFVTAYDQRAIEAFEVNAVDYLLKPIDPPRLETAVAGGPVGPVGANYGRAERAPGPGRGQGQRPVRAGQGRRHHPCVARRGFD
jgi:CheY-like chemotaxis protein